MKRPAKAARDKSGSVRVWLVRHAHAVAAADDCVRPLSPRGRRQIRALGRLLGKSGALQPAEIWHSPLVRSRETAERLSGQLGLGVPLRLVAGLEPEDDPRVVARRLASCGRDVAIVGHEPQLSALASLLVAGAAEPAVFKLKKCSALALERTGARWVAGWLVSPELLP